MFLKIILVLSFIYSSAALAVVGQNGRVPDEYESTAGHSLGLANAGVAAVGGQSAVKMNPAMLALEKQYRISMGYHWPSAGREYYQAGVVDASNPNVAAGVTYTSAQDDYLALKTIQTLDAEDRAEFLFHSRFDTPVKKRISIGVGKAFQKISLGFGFQMVEAWDIDNPGSDQIKGTTLGFGAAGLIVPALRFALSAENMANKQIKNYAPRMYRAGLAYLLNNGDLTIHLDYRDRERINTEVERTGNTDILNGSSEPEHIENLTSEKMASISFSARVQNMLRLLGAYSHELAGNRKTLSGGVAIINNNYSLSYLVSRPYLTDDRLHQAVNLGFDIKL